MTAKFLLRIADKLTYKTFEKALKKLYFLHSARLKKSLFFSTPPHKKKVEVVAIYLYSNINLIQNLKTKQINSKIVHRYK